jgi:2-keto-4-pentenoate hydratase/2-oxohepta-3-ene-1,7-dioic acid hydratase in catechol pathway
MDTLSEPVSTLAMSPSLPFALATFRAADGQPFAALVREDRATALDAHVSPDVTVRGLVEEWDAAFPVLRSLADRLTAPDLEHAVGDLHPLPPLVPPGEIFQAGANYRQHVLDLMSGAESRGDSSDGLSSPERDQARADLDERLQHGQPFVFLGSAHAMVGAHDDVILPSDCAQPDWELELAAVIGRPARRVDRDHAFEHIAGYTMCNDVTARDALTRPDTRSLGLDWLAGKNAPTFLPTGPLFVPAAFVEDPSALQIVLKVNGRTMQDESTADMVFDVSALIEFISNVAELRPGDLVLTGSPAGNGASHGICLNPGDVMEGTISGLGAQRNRCIAEVPLAAEAVA